MARPTNYVKVDNAIGTNPKFMQIDDEHYLEAIGLYVLMLGFCDRGNTDGVMHQNAVSNARGIAPSRTDLLDILTEVGLICVKRGKIHIKDYLEWQRSKDEKETRKAQGKAAADALWDAKRNANSNAERNANGNAQESTGEKKREVQLLNSRFEEIENLVRETLGIDTFSASDRKQIRTWAEGDRKDADIRAALEESRGKDRPMSYANGCLKNGITAKSPAEDDDDLGAYIDWANRPLRKPEPMKFDS